METHIAMKITYKEESTRTMLHVNEMTYEGIKAMTKKSFSIDEAFHFCCVEEDTHVTSQTELYEVIRNAYIHQSTLALRVVKTEKPNPKIPCCPTPLRAPLNHLAALEECCKEFQVCGGFPSHCNFAVHPVACEECLANGKQNEHIIGTRYKCTSCPNYDLCEPCFQKKKADTCSIHEQHHFDCFHPIVHPQGNSIKRRWSHNKGTHEPSNKEEAKLKMREDIYSKGLMLSDTDSKETYLVAF
jgi:hypothetical protein